MFVWKLHYYNKADRKIVSFGPKIRVEMFIEEMEAPKDLDQSGIFCKDVDANALSEEDLPRVQKLQEIFPGATYQDIAAFVKANKGNDLKINELVFNFSQTQKAGGKFK